MAWVETDPSLATGATQVRPGAWRGSDLPETAPLSVENGERTDTCRGACSIPCLESPSSSTETLVASVPKASISAVASASSRRPTVCLPTLTYYPLLPPISTTRRQHASHLSASVVALIHRTIPPHLHLWHSGNDLRLFLFVTLPLTIATFVLVCISGAYTDRTNRSVSLPPSERERLKDPLLDTVHPYFQSLGLPSKLSDYLVSISVTLMLLRCLLLHHHATLVLRRCFAVISLLFLLRGACVLLTELPNPLVTCESNPSEHGLMLDAALIFFQFKASCGDVFFSGHSVWLVTCALVWHTYSPSSLSCFFPERGKGLRVAEEGFKVFSAILAFAGVFSLVASSFHYTIDTVIAVVLTTLVWQVYHWGVRFSPLRGTWWGRVLIAYDGKWGGEVCEEGYELLVPAAPKNDC